MGIRDSLRRFFQGEEREDVRERIREREGEAIETLAQRKDAEAEDFERRGKAEQNIELLALAKKTREEAAILRRTHSADSEHEQLLKALGI